VSSRLFGVVAFVRTGKISRAAFGVALLASVAASGGIGWRAGWQAPPPGWNGKVARIVRGGGAETLGGKTSLAEGGVVASGTSVATDRKQRARLEMNDGSVLVLDRDTEIELDPTPNTRVVRVKHGVVAFDVAHEDNAAPAKIITERGEVLVVGTELTVTATDDTTDVQVSRGSVRAKSESGEVTVEAGQEALITSHGVDVGPSAIGARSGAGSLLGEKKPNEDSDGAGGVGELRARRPGHSDEADRTLRIASHAVKVRIAGAMARTEIEETFSNDTNDDLEGIYRFPVPAGALVDRLALDVDGKLEEGAFVDKTRAEKILKGAIANATPLQKPTSDIVWVPGPWRDPALLEWQQGGRFQLRIFPIPKHGSRRVVLGYTQTVDASLGVRRYVYPLPSVGGVRMDDFSVDAQVLGADGEIRTRGYDLARSGEGKLAFHESAFQPRGDLTIEYALANRKSELSTWTFDAGDSKFFAMAVRPKLPVSGESKPRDWVVVVDDGRTMFGERFERASRVAVSLAQTLDRRDRISVLACDVACRRNAAGFVPAGASAAKAIADFLTPIVPDGASDLSSAVRSAATTSTEAGRELRVVVVSDGVSTAGYSRAGRLEDESRAATPKDAAVLAVPVGDDADTNALSAIARGGGGVVVPYAPGERTEDIALALAGAGEGALLRDATLELPAGFESVAPRVLPTMRVSGETYVVAKMTSGHAQGDVVLRGTAGGNAFEARYPIDVTATGDAGNAFVPRLFASLRIADLERDTGDAPRAEAVALSQKLAVPSRFTSLLVLESEAMFRAFGIDRSTDAPRWTGELAADEHDVATLASNQTSESEKDSDAQQPAGGVLERTRGSGSGGGGGHAGFGDEDLAASKAPAEPMASAAGGPVMTVPMSPPAMHMAAREPVRDAWRMRRPGRFMRRVFHREATIASFDGTADGADRVATARAALAAAPDDRGKHRDLARALLRRGAIDDLEQVVSDWQKRDPLDPDAITLRAEVLSSRGDRKDAERVLSGVAVSGDASRIDDLALGAERAGDDSLACALRIASAEKKSDDATRVARAVRCERARGRTVAADAWLASSNRNAVESALLALRNADAVVSGDVVVDASWSSGADLDVAVVDPSGQRLGWLAGRGRVSDPTSRSHERLAVSSGATGSFLVEIARSDASTDPVSGFVNVTAFGMNKRVPFVLTSASTRVARVDARWTSELVPIDGDGLAIQETSRGTFDAQVARARVQAISLQSCSVQEGPFGAGRATITFDPMSGSVSSVMLDAPFAGTRESWCISRMLRTARISPFSGGAQTIARSFVIAP
jgi:hypothetical protein